MHSNSWDVERRADGAVLVRVHSADKRGEPLPDAVFTFRRGDPQYEHWVRQWRLRCTRALAVSDDLYAPSAPGTATALVK
jgi:hypothetical protein